MKTADIASALVARPLFAGLSEAGLARLAEAARAIPLAKGQILFAQGDPSDAAYVVAHGTMAVATVNGDGQVTHFADLAPGAVFGELAVIDGGPRTAGISAVTDALVLRLPGEVLVALVADEPSFALNLMRDVIAKLRATDHRLEDRSVMSLEDRLAKFLQQAKAGTTVRLTQAQIADRLGVSREAVNRRLRALEEAGAVTLGRGRVVIENEGRL